MTCSCVKHIIVLFISRRNTIFTTESKLRYAHRLLYNKQIKNIYIYTQTHIYTKLTWLDLKNGFK